MQFPPSSNARVWLARCTLACGFCLLVAAPLPALERSPRPFATASLSDRAQEQQSRHLKLPASIAVDYTLLERELFDDLLDRRLDRHTLLTAALVASGVTEPDRLQQYEGKLNEFVQRRQTEGCDDLSPKRRAAALLESLHQELLTSGYQQPCTNLAEVLDEGHFNCVSATILWQCLAERFALESVPVELPGHMNAEIALETGPFEVETTCAQWFRWQLDPARRQQALAQVRGADSSQQPSRRTLDQAALIAAIYYNQGIDLLEAGRFAEAVAANAKAHRLDPDSAIARGNLLASINNWALSLAAEQQYERACQLLSSARRMAPSHAPFQVNYIAIHQQWIDALVSVGQLASADQIAARIARELPEEIFFVRVHDQLQRQLQQIQQRENSI